MAEIFATANRDHWCEVFEGSDACFAPVLNPAEAQQHPHIAARGIYSAPGGVLQAAPAPRLSNTPSAVPGPIPARGQHGADILRAAGLSETAIAGLLRS